MLITVTTVTVTNTRLLFNRRQTTRERRIETRFSPRSATPGTPLPFQRIVIYITLCIHVSRRVTYQL